MAVAFVESYQDASSTTETVNIVATGTDKLLIGSNAGKSTAPATLTGMTLNAVSMESPTSHGVGVGGGQAISHGWAFLRDAAIPAAGNYDLVASFSASVSNNNTTVIELQGVNQSIPIGDVVTTELTAVNDGGSITLTPVAGQVGKFCLYYVGTVDDINNTAGGGHTLPAGFTRIDTFDSLTDTRIIWGYINSLADTTDLTATVSIDGATQIDSVIAGLIAINAVGEGSDVTPPEFSSGPTVTAIGSNTATVTATSNESGTTSSAVVTTFAASQPSNETFDADTTPVTAGVEFAENLTGLPAGSHLRAWVQIKDGAGNRTTDSAVLLTSHTGYNRVVVGTPNSTAANRITSSDDLASGDIVDYGNVQGTGTVIVNDDGTFSASEGVTAFTVYVGTLADGWGAAAVQYVDSAALPDAPTFTDVTGAETGASSQQSFTLSADSTIVPIGTGTTVAVNAGAATSGSTSGSAGDTITVTGYASSQYATPKTVGVSLAGGVSGTWTITTRAAVAPTITAQPSNDTVEAGSPGSFSVTMTDAASYQWYLVGTGAVSGATANTFAPTTASGDAGTTRQYYVIGTSSEGGTVQSDTVTLTITNATTTFTSAEQLRDNGTKALLANTLVNYKLITADGTEITGSATTDASGYLSDSSVDFGTAGDTVIVYGEFGTYITGFKAVLS